MIRTRVGYAGGQKANPTYKNIADHAESIEIDFDPSIITYADLLSVFWTSHTPTRGPWSRQYMSAIFFHNAAQGELALASKERYETEKGQQVFTEISRLDRFYWAEDYHQKYALRRYRPLTDEFKAHYPRLEDFVNSMATTRVNGYLSGYGDFAQLKAEIEDYGISEAGQKTLLDVMAQYQSYGR